MRRDGQATGAPDSAGAFVPGTDVRVPGVPGCPLSDLAFAVKDLFDIAGEPTGGGNPDWCRANPVPERHAAIVSRLLAAGASVAGKTITDEVSLGILGENAFHGTPRNAEAPGFVPGGSSSGSAAAVAAGLVDFALGSDTGGSVRVPASFCGLYGLRPTHGRIDLEGLMPQAPSFDTAGWFARGAATFGRVSEVVLDEAGAAGAPAFPDRLLVARDAFAFAEPGVAGALEAIRERVAALAGATVETTVAPQGLSVWARAQRTLQIPEALATFREWIERTNPRLSMRVAQMLVAAGAVTPAERQWAELMRHEVRGRLRDLLGTGSVLCLPTTPFPAPPLGLALSRQNEIGLRIASLTAIAGLSGLPQLSVPGPRADGRPVGLSLIGPPGSDLRLAALARELEDSG
ncbi:MAG: amidase [Immundisolibacterales bacterium]|nr:amidase [Immundisolibacterales bacterium]